MEHLKSCYVLESGNKVLLCSNISSFIFFVTVSSDQLKDLSHLDKNIFVLTHTCVQVQGGIYVQQRAENPSGAGSILPPCGSRN